MKITARCPKTLKILDLEFTSIKEAKKHNPYLIDFAINVIQLKSQDSLQASDCG